MKYSLLFALALSALAFTACNDADDPAVYDVSSSAAAPQNLTLTDATTTTLSFSWDAVPAATQYGYKVALADGTLITGGTTTNTSAKVTGLQLFTDYQIAVSAIPALGNGAPSTEVLIAAKTAFYDRLDNEPGTYSTFLTSADGDGWTAILDEDRSAPDYEEGTFGTFTLQKFFNRASASLKFIVNRDQTITILNATGHDADGWAMVATGMPQAARKTLYIDEASSYFDREARSLTYMARFGNSPEPTEDSFKW